jgi:hypothetical protein
MFLGLWSSRTSWSQRLEEEAIHIMVDREQSKK